MKTKVYFLLLLLFLLWACSPAKKISAYESEDLVVKKIGKHTYLHLSYLESETFGRVPCNGMIVVDKGEAIIFDTPATEKVSDELIQWVRQQLGTNIKAVVPTHFHEDCLGGLQAFHDAGIASYALNHTIQLAQKNGATLPQNGFDGTMRLAIGHTYVECAFLGEGHTYDNIVAYFPKDHALFGGCLIKADGAGKGNLADANVETWSTSVKNVKAAYPDARTVVPGHGKYGGIQLLDFTIQLFR